MKSAATKPPDKPPLSLEEARKRWHRQLYHIREKARLGKLTRHKKRTSLAEPFSDAAIWEVISWADEELWQDAAHRDAEERRRERMRWLGEWLSNVIRTKNSARKLEHLDTCLKAHENPLPERVTDMQFAHWLGAFLWTYEELVTLLGIEDDDRKIMIRLRREAIETDAERSKVSVPTLKQLRDKLKWTHKNTGQVAKRLEWSDLPKDKGGNPRDKPKKVSPPKRRMR